MCKRKKMANFIFISANKCSRYHCSFKGNIICFEKNFLWIDFSCFEVRIYLVDTIYLIHKPLFDEEILLLNDSFECFILIQFTDAQKCTNHQLLVVKMIFKVIKHTGKYKRTFCVWCANKYLFCFVKV